MKLLYEGKAKQLFEGPEPGTVIIRFKDSVTAGNAAKRAQIPEKGALSAAISLKLLELVGAAGIPTHLVKLLDERSFLARRVEIIPLEVVVRNRAAGSIVRRLGLERGRAFEPPLIELFYKSDELGDPLLCESHVQLLELARPDELQQIKRLALRAQGILKDYFTPLQLELVDLKFEFGRVKEQIILADEISPDTMRLWDSVTGQSLDKDVFREDKGELGATYLEVARRMGVR